MKKISPDILDRYAAGKCTPEERAMVDEWFALFESEPDDPQLLDQETFNRLDEKMLMNIRARVNANAAYELKSSRGNSSSKKATAPLTRTLYRAVVGVAATLIAGLVFYVYTNRAPAPTNADLLVTQVVNTTGSIIRHELEDGTMIWIHPNSKIEFPSKFLKNSRDLKLHGEAFFEVTKDPLRPFIITTDNVTTQVLGTSFNIKAYDKDASIEVSVLTGKVSVHVARSENKVDSSSTILLTPNQRVTYIKKKDILEKEVPKALPELSMWHATNVVFDNVPVKEVLVTLNKKFDAHIEVRNKNLLNCLIKADFTNQNLPDILELLSKSVEATYEFQNDTIYLTGEGCVN